MKKILLTSATVCILGVLSTTVEASDWFHGSTHHDLNHREQYRQQIHHNAHHGWMSPWQHYGLHQSLNHSRYHDQLQHDLSHYGNGSWQSPLYGGYGTPGLWYGH